MATIECKHCGGKITTETEDCPHCGADLGSRATKIIVFTVTAAICAVLAVLYVQRSGLIASIINRGAEQSQTSTQHARDKSSEAGHACFAAAKEKMNQANLLYEGSDVLLRSGDTYTLRVRVLDSASSDHFRRAIFSCEVAETQQGWSVVRIVPAG